MPEPSTLTHKRYAICVGINTYVPSSELNSLRFAEHDARAMDEMLGTLGFEQDDRVLLLGEQATMAAINEALNEMTDRAEENDLVVFYFAGHGVPLYFEKDDTHDVFLASYDFDPQKLEQRRSLRTRDALGMERLRREYFEGQGSRKRLFLFDSCYSGEFAGFRSGGEQAVQQHMQKMLDSAGTGRVALLSCLPEQVAVETVKHGHGRFTYYLLQALQGKAPDALRRDGWLTVNTLFEYLSQQLPEAQRPVLSGIQHDVFEIVCYSDLVRPASEQTSALQRASATSEKEAYVRAMLADHSDFLRDRLESFVGREQEVVELRQRIRDKMPTGGYVIITGQAGQGKSSIMAKLVDSYGREQVPFHFIPFNPGPDHQVGLLRNLMARLVLKYQLSDIYVSAEHRATLRDYFPNVLREVAAKGGLELIFIDGLDQIEEDVNGVRDLSFLPTNPPAGIVFVLATRPDDALRPLVLLKPHEQYPLPNLRREDFDLILQHRGVTLEPHLADQFYQAMSENALYLDLVAKELHGNPGLSPQEMIAHIAHNPDNIFTLAITRFKRQPLEWREVIKPILGILLAAREPLFSWHLRQILGLDDERLRDGITRLGGLLRESGQRQYSLFHLKWQEYLRQDEQRPEKDYVFATNEEEQWHERLATWCEPIADIWEDSPNRREQGRREYARYHYIQHLYGARCDEKLFEVLDEGSYGKAKERYDRTNRSYIQDLDLGRRAAIRYGKETGNETDALPLLWKYTLLRGSLRSQADNYPIDLFQTLLLFNREKEVLGLVELITKDERRVTILILLGFHFAKNSKQRESMQIFFRAISAAQMIEDASRRSWALCAIVKALSWAQQWERAEAVAREIEDELYRAQSLQEISLALAQAQEWERAEGVLREAEEFGDAPNRVEVLCAIVKALTQEQQWERAEAVARRIGDALYRVQALQEISLELVQAQEWKRAEEILRKAEEVAHEIRYNSCRAKALCEIGHVFVVAQKWERVEEALRKAEEVTQRVEDDYGRVEALCERAELLVQMQERKRAAAILKEAERAALGIYDLFYQVAALGGIARALAKAQQWEAADAIAAEIHDDADRARVLRDVARVVVQEQQWERAQEVLKQAEETANLIRDIDDRVDILIEIAEVLVQAQEWERAQEVLRQAEELAREIEEASFRAESLNEIVKVLAQMQEWKRAKEMLKQAEEAAREIEDGWSYARALCEIANALVQAQEWERAEEVLRKAEEVAQKIGEGWRRHRALDEIQQLVAQTQQRLKSEEVMSELEKASSWVAPMHKIVLNLIQAQDWERAETEADKIEDASDRALALREIARNMSQEQRLLIGLIQRTWLLAETREYAFQVFPLAHEVIKVNPDLGISFATVLAQVDAFLSK